MSDTPEFVCFDDECVECYACLGCERDIPCPGREDGRHTYRDDLTEEVLLV